MQNRLVCGAMLGYFSGSLPGQTNFPNKVYRSGAQFLGYMKYIYEEQTIETHWHYKFHYTNARPEVSSRFWSLKSQRKRCGSILHQQGFALYNFNRDKVSNNFYWTSLGSALVITTYLNFHLDCPFNREVCARYNQLQLQQNSLNWVEYKSNIWSSCQSLAGWNRLFK